MAYLHCHNCDWSQDDFWCESYNPLRYLVEAWEKTLLNKDLEQQFTNDAGFIERHGDLSYRDFLIMECGRAARKIGEMVWRTQEEFIATGSFAGNACPNCGKHELDID
jgi:hypothetical protein